MDESPRTPRFVGRHGTLGLTFALMFAALAPLACQQGCRAQQATQPENNANPAGVPTLRVYVVSDLAGALEPCGCVKDQLGGLDHFAAWVNSERKQVPSDIIVTAGPLFFLDPELKSDRASQDVAKAETIARALGTLKLAALSPGENDFAAKVEGLKKLRDLAGAEVLFANAKDGAKEPVYARSTIVTRGDLKIGLIGVAAPDGMDVAPATAAVKDEVRALKGKGVELIIALAAVGRGEAKRIADLVPELSVIVVGSRGGKGDANTETPGGERIGNVIIAETGNHLQTAVAVDFFVRDGKLQFADGSALEQEGKRKELQHRIDELRGKIADWERDKKIDARDLDARKADLRKLESERAELDRTKPPTQGSFFRYTVKEIRESLGSDQGVTDAMHVHYKQINEANKIAFAGRVPKPAAPNEPSYIGVDACSKCHAQERKVWDGTAHAHAYATLSTQFKEFNLDCVSCHVTGYDIPGGSTVTHVDKLQDVQCEVCHGAGSKHAAAPEKVRPPIPMPKGDQCLACHHAPHVHTFNPSEKMSAILGPGHGL